MSQEDLQILESVLDQLPEKDRSFAGDLVRKGQKYGLSPKQAYWVKRLADRALGKPEPTSTSISSCIAIYRLFDTAAQKLKYPKIVLEVAEHGTLQLHRAGERSKQPGVINITDGGRYPDNQWYGRITRDGTWQQGRGEIPPWVVALIKRFADDPVATAVQYGKHTGQCCFCNQTLEDERSTSAGYGPICAKNWRLPWGKKTNGFTCQECGTTPVPSPGVCASCDKPQHSQEQIEDFEREAAADRRHPEFNREVF